MSEIEGIRKLLQDLVTPDLKSLQLQVGNLEKTLQTSVSSLEKNSEAAISSLEKNVSIRLDSIKDITAQQLKTQQVEIVSAIEQKLVQILASVEAVNSRLSYFESRYSSERHTPVYASPEDYYIRKRLEVVAAPENPSYNPSDVERQVREILRDYKLPERP